MSELSGSIVRFPLWVAYLQLTLSCSVVCFKQHKGERSITDAVIHGLGYMEAG